MVSFLCLICCKRQSLYTIVDSIPGGLIPLHNACSFGHAEVVKLLLKNGADGNARDNWNFTPLHEAAVKGKVDVCIGKKSLYSMCCDNDGRGNHHNCGKF
jgi:hypothetical protein